MKINNKKCIKNIRYKINSHSNNPNNYNSNNKNKKIYNKNSQIKIKI